MKIDLIAQLPF